MGLMGKADKASLTKHSVSRSLWGSAGKHSLQKVKEQRNDQEISWSKKMRKAAAV